MAHHNRAGQRVLSELELRAYMAKLPEQTIMTRLALELDLMLGGQRPTQLLRVKAADVDVTSNPGEIVLLDPKGARRQARVHVLPLVGRSLFWRQTLYQIPKPTNPPYQSIRVIDGGFDNDMPSLLSGVLT